jgi:hypothetical protein
MSGKDVGSGGELQYGTWKALVKGAFLARDRAPFFLATFPRIIACSPWSASRLGRPQTLTFHQKISVLQHDPSSHLPQRPGDPTPTSRNLDPMQHPFARARERIRAVNAAKMERMFAKPFVGALEGHVDAVEVLTRKPDSLSLIASGSWDGGMCVVSS